MQTVAEVSAIGRERKPGRWCGYLAGIFLFCLLPLSQALAKESRDIFLVVSSEEGATQLFRQTLTQRLSDHTFEFRIKTLHVDELDSWRWPSTPTNAVAIALGGQASQRLAQTRPPLPVLSVLITRNNYRALQPVFSALPRGHAVIYVDQPPSRLLAFAQMILPDAGSFAILGRPEVVNGLDEADAVDLTFHALRADARHHLADDIRELVTAGEAVIVTPSTSQLTPNAVKWLLLGAYQKGKPVIGYSRAFAKAGAVASIFSTPQQMARQAAKLIAKHFDVEGDRLEGRYFPEEFEIEVNQWVARSMQLTTPDVQSVVHRLQERERR